MPNIIWMWMIGTHTIPVHDPMSISGLDILLKTGTLERVLQQQPPLLHMSVYCSYYINCKPHPHITISNIILPFCFNDNNTRSGPRSKLNLPPPHLHWTRNHHHNVPSIPFPSSVAPYNSPCMAMPLIKTNFVVNSLIRLRCMGQVICTSEMQERALPQSTYVYTLHYKLFTTS